MMIFLVMLIGPRYLLDTGLRFWVEPLLGPLGIGLGFWNLITQLVLMFLLVLFLIDFVYAGVFAHVLAKI